MIQLNELSMLFRNKPQLALLSEIITEMLSPAYRREDPFTVSIYGMGHGGCEATSLRITLREMGIPDDQVEILSSDHSAYLIDLWYSREYSIDHMVDRAGNNLVPEEIMQKYFYLDENTWRLTDETIATSILLQVSFVQFEDSQSDIVMFQNATPFILDEMTCESVIKGAVEKTRGGGYVLLGGYDKHRTKALAKLLSRGIITPCMKDAKAIHDGWLDRRSGIPEVVEAGFDLGEYISDPLYCSIFRKV